MNVLIVHENPKILNIIKELVELENKDSNIETADNIQKTEDHIRNHKPDIIICNTLISNICCLSLIKSVREILPGVKFICIGDLRRTPCRRECLDYEPDVLLNCPDEFDKVRETFKMVKILVHPSQSTPFGKEGPGCHVPRYLLSSPESRHKNKGCTTS